MNRRERLIFWVYVVLAIVVVLFLVATGVLWWLGGWRSRGGHWHPFVVAPFGAA